MSEPTTRTECVNADLNFFRGRTIESDGKSNVGRWRGSEIRLVPRSSCYVYLKPICGSLGHPTHTKCKLLACGAVASDMSLHRRTTKASISAADPWPLPVRPASSPTQSTSGFPCHPSPPRTLLGVKYKVSLPSWPSFSTRIASYRKADETSAEF